MIGGRIDEVVIKVKPTKTTNPLYTNTFLAPNLVIKGKEHKVKIITSPNKPEENKLLFLTILLYLKVVFINFFGLNKIRVLLCNLLLQS